MSKRYYCCGASGEVERIETSLRNNIPALGHVHEFIIARQLVTLGGFSARRRFAIRCTSPDGLCRLEVGVAGAEDALGLPSQLGPGGKEVQQVPRDDTLHLHHVEAGVSRNLVVAGPADIQWGRAKRRARKDCERCRVDMYCA